MNHKLIRINIYPEYRTGDCICKEHGSRDNWHQLLGANATLGHARWWLETIWSREREPSLFYGKFLGNKDRLSAV